MTAEVANRKVRMSPELMEQWATRDALGYRLLWDWGEPDAEGFYTPVVTRLANDNLISAERARIAEGVRGLPSMGTTDEWDDDGLHRNAENVERAAVLAIIGEKP